jgi:CPA1 family monovalent cation:H+ antiporter
MGLRGPRLIDPRTRLQGFHTWDVLDFIVNSILFVLIGLQLPSVVDGLSGYGAGELALYAVAISLAVIVSRFLWLFTTPYVIRALDRRPEQRLRRVGWRARVVVGWSGMRGSVSLAAALALPLETDAHQPFPARELIIFLVFAVIAATLVLQGLTLPAVMHALGVEEDGADAREELDARLAANAAALERIDAIEARGELREESVTNLRRLYEFRQRRLEARSEAGDGVADIDERSRAYQGALRSVLAAERDALVGLRDRSGISNEVMNRVLRELDLEEARLEI